MFPAVVQEAWQASLEFWLWVAAAAFCGPFLGRMAFMSALLYLPLSLAMVISAFGPLLTVVLQYWWFQIGTTTYQLLGGSLVILGIVFGVLSQPKARKPA